MKYSSITILTLFFILLGTYAYGQVGSNCPIENYEAEADGCSSDTTFVLIIDMDYQNADDTFELLIDDISYGLFQFKELPLQIDTAQSVSGVDHAKVKVCHATVPNCCRVENVDLPDCLVNLGCKIDNLTLDIIDCDNLNYSLDVSFDYQDVGNSGFALRVNGLIIGVFNYADLPVNTGILIDDGNDVEVEVADVDFPDCSEEEDIESPVCGGTCEIEDLELKSVNCDADTFYIQINFDSDKTGMNGFNLLVNAVDSGNFDYGDLPLVIGPFIDDGNDIDVEVSDADDPQCGDQATLEADETDCLVNNNCKIRKLQLEIIDCTTDSTYGLWINFDRENVDDSFTLYANGQFFGEFAYDSLPIIIDFPSKGTKWDNIVVCDNANNTCCKHGKVRVPDCITVNKECKIGRIFLGPVNCRMDSFELDVWFIHRNSNEEGFNLLVNGMPYGNFDYANLPVRIGPFPNDIGEVTVQVTDIRDGQCRDMESIDNFDCSVPDSLICHISNINVLVGECTSDDTYTITVDFDHADVSDSFNLSALPNKFLGRYSYNDLPVTINDFPARGTPFDLVKICNVGPPNCCKVQNFRKPDCIERNPGFIDPEERINIFPNPGNRRMVIEINEKVKVNRSYLLTPGSGRVELELEENQGVINVSEYRPGYYFLIIESDEGNMIKQIIITD